MSERNQEAQRLAEEVVSGGIVQKATERLVYQIVEVCAEHERENTDALRARVAKLEAALIEVGDFLADDCVENYPFDRIPGSFADEADRLLKLIKASVGDTPQ